MNTEDVEPSPDNPEQRKVVVIPSEITITAVPPLLIDDERSQKGQFGWAFLAKEHIPYIFRGENAYVSARIIETNVLSKFINFLHQDIFVKCLMIKSFYITLYEAKLFNEINFFHCDGQFGPDQFTGMDSIISLGDAESLCEFLEFCLRKLTEKNAERCGFVKINDDSSVPFVITNDVKCVPLFYFEGDINKLKNKAIRLTGWELAYLKFLCRIQNLQNDLFTSDSCSVIDVREIFDRFPPGTTFTDDWPESASELLVGGGEVKDKLSGFWAQPPKTPPVFNCGVVQKMKTATNVLKENSNTNKNAQAANALQRIFAPKFILKPSQPHRLLNGSSLGATSSKEPTQPPEQVRFLIPIPEPTGKKTYCPYKFQRVIIDEKTMPCINKNAYIYHDFLMVCIIDLNEYLFKNVPFHICSSVIQALKVPLYKANTCQVNVFMSNNRFRYCNTILPLIQVKDVVQYLPQMKYMLASNGDQKLQQVININNQRAKN